MRSINKVILIGNLTRDPEMRQTPNGQNVVTFGLATNREWVTRDGRKQNSAEFHDLVAWAKLADICQTYLKKGKLVYVEGYLKTRSWDTPEGIKKFRTEIVVQDMIMLDKKSGEESMDYMPENTGDDNHGSYDEPTLKKKEKPVENAEEKYEEQTAEKSEPQEMTEENPKTEPTPQPEQTQKEESNETDKDEEKHKASPPAATQSLDIDSDLGL